jgi:jumonji domain-containing protein 7
VLVGERTLERVSVTSLSRAAFLATYYYPHRPVILTDGIDDWEARGWTPDALKRLLGDRQVDVRVSESGLLFDNRTGASATERMRFADFADRLTRGGAEKKMYFAQQSLRDLIPDHARYVPRFRYLRSGDYLQTINLWFGDRGCVTPLHFDFVHNYFAQLYGRKEFVIFAPEDRPYLYANTDLPMFYFVSKVAVLEPDLGAYPAFTRATPIRFVLGPGDVLFLPCGWWHFVHSLDVSISVNQWWARALSRNTRQLGLLLEAATTFARSKLPAFLGGRPASAGPTPAGY